ncbi:thiamine pyrophosphate-requiring protein [Pusillimonas noertemannii]|uniref:Acetolactate synthase-1/2/3 large subunit n=1 Tax=Pusillimonas noertemannii TaxID=305977 RepID=A0A2U1CL42_9BURK|nr:thiamine pyrophosphate-requiring protein [Pusillimonas noertemannii]PVY61712.1 acetolactate synthase-1/2/3 large subunit [Pusillimonas noertemannii]
MWKEEVRASGICEVPEGTTGDAIVAALAAGGVDCLFFTSGSEICFYQEAIAKAKACNRPAPRLIVMTHEHVGLNAALGYSAVTGKPSATAVHVDAGTLHHGAAIHTAMHAGLPIVMTAGHPPTSATGSSSGARNTGAHLWLQETFDQHSVVRQYVKWDHRLTAHDDPGLQVSRAIQVAASEPCGPVYLTIPPEVSMSPRRAHAFPTLSRLGKSVPPAPDPAGVRELIQRLLAARNPKLIVAGSGRNPDTVPELVELCQLLGLPVVHGATLSYLSFPMAHPLMQLDRDLSDADVVVALETDVPWMPGPSAPPDDAWVAVLGLDPIKGKIPTYEFRADLRLACDPLRAIRALREEADRAMRPSDHGKAAKRAEAAGRASQAQRAALQAQVPAIVSGAMIDPLQVGQALAKVLDERAIVLDDTLAHNRIPHFLQNEAPGSYFHTPGTSGGWAPGAAFGASLGAPDRDIVAVTGDGFYIFGTPAPALWAGVHYKAPFLTVVYQNRSWATGTVRLASMYPNGYAQRADFEGGYFDPPMDFALEAESAGAYGESVRDPVELEPALRRGLRQVRAGRPAVVSIWLPRHMHDD